MAKIVAYLKTISYFCKRVTLNEKAMKKIVLLFVSVFICLIANAQSNYVDFNGTILDESGVPIPGARVLVRAQRNNFVAGTVTDVNGRFTLLISPGYYKVEFSMVGYEPQINYMNITSSRGVTIHLHVLKTEYLAGLFAPQETLIIPYKYPYDNA